MIAMVFSFVRYDNKHYIMMQFEQWNEAVCRCTPIEAIFPHWGHPVILGYGRDVIAAHRAPHLANLAMHCHYFTS
jgi:hypothetical protein